MHLGVLRNGALARALLSFGIAYTAEWAFTVAIGVVAFEHGGAFAVGLVGVIRLLPAAVLAPAVATFADRMARERVLTLSGAARGLATLAAAAVLAYGGPIWAVYLLAVISTIAFTPFRASHSALMPSLCRHPDELTAVNVARGALHSLSLVVGPLTAALLIDTAGTASVFLFAGGCALVSAALVVRLTYERVELRSDSARHLLDEVREGFGAVVAVPGVRIVMAFVVLQTALRGAWSVFVVVIAIDLLALDQANVGVLQGAVGVGALVGSALCAQLVGSRMMARWLGFGVVLWGLPLAIVGLTPSPPTALLTAGLIGVGTALVDVAGFTLLARMIPDALLARVFGVRESLGAVGVCIGSLGAPALIEMMGIRTALLAVSSAAPLALVLLWGRLRAVDASVSVRTDVITLFRRVPMLHLLPMPVIEQLAQSQHLVEKAPGETVFEVGDSGDTFYVIAHGSVEVVDSGRVVRTMSVGDGFGEIALLGGVTRTMTVRAAQRVRLHAVTAAAFIGAVSSIPGALTAGEETASTYLSHAPGSSVPKGDSA